jgi:hypothetical protein
LRHCKKKPYTESDKQKLALLSQLLTKLNSFGRIVLSGGWSDDVDEKSRALQRQFLLGGMSRERYARKMNALWRKHAGVR